MPIDSPEIVQLPAQPTAIIRFIIPRAQIREIMQPGIEELMATVKAQLIGPTGPVFSHHLRLDPAQFDFELGVPVSAPVTPHGRVHPGMLPAGRAARTIYRGPYEGLGAAWEEFDRWIVGGGYIPAPNLWERYLTAPGARPEDTATELVRPALDRPAP